MFAFFRFFENKTRTRVLYIIGRKHLFACGVPSRKLKAFNRWKPVIARVLGFIPKNSIMGIVGREQREQTRHKRTDVHSVRSHKNGYFSGF